MDEASNALGFVINWIAVLIEHGFSVLSFDRNTGYDTKACETMTYFYDTQAWLPKNVTFMNKAAFDRLDKPTQEALLRVAAAAEARGWWRSRTRQMVYRAACCQRLEGAVAQRCAKDGTASDRRASDQRVALKAGADGQAIVDEYKLGFPDSRG